MVAVISAATAIGMSSSTWWLYIWLTSVTLKAARVPRAGCPRVAVHGLGPLNAA
jgi:hypothetical protein